MSKPTFAKTGIHTRILKGAEITRFQVLGERSSGTNFCKRLLGRNTALKPTEALGWKHGFHHAPGIPGDLLVIGMVRRADDWLRSMHAKPWHCSPQMQELGFSDFIRARWDTQIDRARYFEGSTRAGIVGQPLQFDRHPISGKRFKNILALRQAKLASLLGYFDRNCSFILIRMEEMADDPETALERIRLALHMPASNAPFQPVHKRLGSKFRAADGIKRPPTPSQLSASDYAFMRANVHLGQEKALGYKY